MTSGIWLRVFSVVPGVVFCLSCTSRQWVKPGNYELAEGIPVYSLVTADGDTIEYSGRSAEPDRNDFTGDEFFSFEGEGAVFQDNTVKGVLIDGSQVEVGILDVASLQTDIYDSGRTILLNAGAVTAVGFILYVAGTGLADREPVIP